MKYILNIKMNDSDILTAAASTVIAYENILHIVSTYQTEKGVMTPMVPNMLGRMLEAEPGEVFSDRWRSFDGHRLEYTATKISA